MDAFTQITIEQDANSGLFLAAFWTEEGQDFSFWSDTKQIAFERTLWIKRAYQEPAQADPITPVAHAVKDGMDPQAAASLAVAIWRAKQ